ncbi:hypothetical protein C0992_011405, partial [Termitomyces sp. T32_za158]
YEEYREILREVDEGLNLETLLGSKEGLRATIKFLDKSGAFTKIGEPRMNPNKPTENDEENDKGTEEGIRERGYRAEEAQEENGDEELEEMEDEEGSGYGEGDGDGEG